MSKRARIRVGVIFGGQSSEHDVSLESAQTILTGLNADLYDILQIGVTREGRWFCSSNALQMLRMNGQLDEKYACVLLPEPRSPGLLMMNTQSGTVIPVDVFLPMIHGTYGEDGKLQGLLELAGIPYVGSGVLGSSVGMDKIVQKQVFKGIGLRVTKFEWELSSNIQERPKEVCKRVERKLHYPIFVKPSNAGSSVGISKAHSRQELLGGMTLAAKYDRRVIFEQGINDAREIECSILGNEEPIASLLGEIIPSHEFYDYDAKYSDAGSRTNIPAAIEKKVGKRIIEMARKAYAAIDAVGMARADFLLTPRGTIYVNELNTIPGFTANSMYPKLWGASGIPLRELLDRLIQLALEHHTTRALLSRVYVRNGS